MNIIQRVEICQRCKHDGIPAELQNHLVANGQVICCCCGGKISILTEPKHTLPDEIGGLVRKLMESFMFSLVDQHWDTPFQSGSGQVIDKYTRLFFRNRSRADFQCIVSWCTKSGSLTSYVANNLGLNVQTMKMLPPIVDTVCNAFASKKFMGISLNFVGPRKILHLVQNFEQSSGENQFLCVQVELAWEVALS